MITTNQTDIQTDGALHIILASDDSSEPIRLERRGGDVFFVNEVGDIIAALVQMGTSNLCTAGMTVMLGE